MTWIMVSSRRFERNVRACQLRSQSMQELALHYPWIQGVFLLVQSNILIAVQSDLESLSRSLV